MDKDLLRRQIVDEIQAEFDTKLRQAKRQKEEAEEELEAASERWRAEKRRLNAEIDRLEAELVDAKAAAARKQPQSDLDTAPDQLAVARLQEAADEKLKNATAEWERERGQLKSQINRLESAVAEAIARASNPLRSTQPMKEQFEIELNRVAQEKTEIEQAFLRAKTQWEQEQLKMTGEMVKLRRAAKIMGQPVPKEENADVNPKLRDLENQLKESHAKWSAEREELTKQIHRLEQNSRHWDIERRQLNDHAGQLQQAFVKAQAQVQTYEASARAPNPSEAQIEQLRREKEGLQTELQETRRAWEAERRQLKKEIERLEGQIQRASESQDHVSKEFVDQLRKRYEERLQEAVQEKNQLAGKLQTTANALLEAERTPRSGGQTKNSGLDNTAIAAEVSRVESLIKELVALMEDPDTELSTIIRKNVEKAELDAYLKGIMFASRPSK
jgi:DNA repair exonuclease SbcCD ATPase subunit